LASPRRALGADLAVLDGPAAGQRFGCIGRIGEILVADFANGDELSELAAGASVRVDNHRFLAYCFMHRHQVDPDGPGADQFVVASRPVYRQEPQNLQDVLVGVRAQARFDGKLVYVGSMNDSMSNPLGWPVTYASRARSRLGDAATGRLRVWLNENATHIQGSERPASGTPAPATRLVDWIGCVEQAVGDLVAWVEDDQPPPPDTRFKYSGGQLELPRSAAARGGLQPVVSATADGGITARVAAGAPVLLAVNAEVPPRAGRIVAVEWDFDGAGTWSYREAGIDGTRPTASAAVQHAYAQPGTYYPAVRVTAHRRGDMAARYGLTCNLARVRVDVI
jgi:hypothetical protein